MTATATARKFYLQAVRPCKDAWHFYLPGRIARTARGAPRWFRSYEAAAEYRRSLDMRGCFDIVDIRD
jgi:hypothetical protein